MPLPPKLKSKRHEDYAILSEEQKQQQEEFLSGRETLVCLPKNILQSIEVLISIGVLPSRQIFDTLSDITESSVYEEVYDFEEDVFQLYYNGSPVGDSMQGPLPGVVDVDLSFVPVLTENTIGDGKKITIVPSRSTPVRYFFIIPIPQLGNASKYYEINFNNEPDVITNSFLSETGNSGTNNANYDVSVVNIDNDVVTIQYGDTTEQQLSFNNINEYREIHRFIVRPEYQTTGIRANDYIYLNPETVFLNSYPVANNTLFGIQERFVDVGYILPEQVRASGVTNTSNEIKLFNKGFTGKGVYSRLATQNVKNPFFQSSLSLQEGNVLSSICTDQNYLNVMVGSIISAQQTLPNIRISDYMSFTIEYDTFVVNNILDISASIDTDGNEGLSLAELALSNNQSTLTFQDLYFQRIKKEGYQFTADYFDVYSQTSSNRFWVLPDAFQKNGITYEVVLDSVPEKIFETVSELNNLEFTVKDNILTINKPHRTGINKLNFLSYKLVVSNPLYGNPENDPTLKVGRFDSQWTIIPDLNYENVGVLPENLNINYGDISYNTTIYAVRSTSTSLTVFSFKNNIYEGIPGTYHLLDRSKLAQTGEGFHFINLYSELERKANLLINQVDGALTIDDVNYYNRSNSILTDEDIAYYKQPTTGPVSYKTFRNVSIMETGSIYVRSLPTDPSHNIVFHRVDFTNTGFFESLFTEIDFNECNFTDATFISELSAPTQLINCRSSNNVWSNYLNLTLDTSYNPAPPGTKFTKGQFLGHNNSGSLAIIKIRDFRHQGTSAEPIPSLWYDDWNMVTAADWFNNSVADISRNHYGFKGQVDLSFNGGGADPANNRVDFVNIRGIVNVSHDIKLGINTDEIIFDPSYIIRYYNETDIHQQIINETSSYPVNNQNNRIFMFDISQGAAIVRYYEDFDNDPTDYTDIETSYFDISNHVVLLDNSPNVRRSELRTVAPYYNNGLMYDFNFTMSEFVGYYAIDRKINDNGQFITSFNLSTDVDTLLSSYLLFTKSVSIGDIREYSTSITRTEALPIEFNQVSFANTNFFECTFTDICFNRCTFEGADFASRVPNACFFVNCITTNCVWPDYTDDFVINGSNLAPPGTKFTKGRIIGRENLHGNPNIIFRSPTRRYYDVLHTNYYNPYDTTNHNKYGMIGEFDLSFNGGADDNNRVDFVNIRGLVTVKHDIKLNVNTDDIVLDPSYIIRYYNETDIKIQEDQYLVNPYTYPVNNGTIRHFLFESRLSSRRVIDAGGIEINSPYIDIDNRIDVSSNLTRNTKFMHEYDSNGIQTTSTDISYHIYKFNNGLDISYSVTKDEFIGYHCFDVTVNDSGAFETAGLSDNINNLFEDEYFYDYQFQKSLDDPRGLKLIGIRNISTGDHKNNGTWAIVKYPYRTGPGEDIIVSFDRQLMGIQQQGLLDSGNGPELVDTVKGPLTYYQLDTRFTQMKMQFREIELDTDKTYGDFVMKVRNLNYSYLDRTSLRRKNNFNEEPIHMSVRQKQTYKERYVPFNYLSSDYDTIEYFTPDNERVYAS